MFVSSDTEIKNLFFSIGYPNCVGYTILYSHFIGTDLRILSPSISIK